LASATRDRGDLLNDGSPPEVLACMCVPEKTAVMAVASLRQRGCVVSGNGRRTEELCRTVFRLERHRAAGVPGAELTVAVKVTESFTNEGLCDELKAVLVSAARTCSINGVCRRSVEVAVAAIDGGIV